MTLVQMNVFYNKQRSKKSFTCFSALYGIMVEGVLVATDLGKYKSEAFRKSFEDGISEIQKSGHESSRKQKSRRNETIQEVTKGFYVYNGLTHS